MGCDARGVCEFAAVCGTQKECGVDRDTASGGWTSGHLGVVASVDAVSDWCEKKEKEKRENLTTENTEGTEKIMNKEGAR